jgi:very-short-patch-repair endonuclease
MPKKKSIKICKECKTEHYRRSYYCSKECSKIQQKKPEFREKISKARKKYLLENPDKHPWKNSNKFKSVPCEKVKEFLNSKHIRFVEEWQPLENRYFSIDIAFPDIKFGIEINGNQHYDKNGNLKPYYQERHNLIEQAGWKLLELHYTCCFNLSLIENILNLKEQPDYSEYFELQKNKIKIQTLPKGQKRKNDFDEKWEPYKQIIMDSDIDFSKFGWVSETAKILKISPQKINKWMKRYLPDFYEQKCFKRKPQVTGSIPVGDTNYGRLLEW